MEVLQLLQAPQRRLIALDVAVGRVRPELKPSQLCDRSVVHESIVPQSAHITPGNDPLVKPDGNTDDVSEHLQGKEQ